MSILRPGTLEHRLALAVGLALSSVATAAHAQETLSAGGQYTIAPEGMACVVSETVVVEGPQMTINKGCDGARSILFMDSGVTLLPVSIHVTASVRRIAQFSIDEGAASGGGGWMPVHIAIPVRWKGRALNDSLDPTDISGYLSVNSIARLTEGTSGNPGVPGRTIYEAPFQGFTHGGPNACLSVPKGKVSAGLTAAKCLLGFFMNEEGSSHVDLVAVVQAGQTYNVEIEIQGELYSADTSAPIVPSIIRAHPKINFESLGGTPFGLSIDGDIRVTVGSNGVAELRDLQHEVDKLRHQINRLRHDLATHKHAYLTGRGPGHNNKVAITGAAVKRHEHESPHRMREGASPEGTREAP
jgi:hypothetical protein